MLMKAAQSLATFCVYYQFTVLSPPPRRAAPPAIAYRLLPCLAATSSLPHATTMHSQSAPHKALQNTRIYQREYQFNSYCLDLLRRRAAALPDATRILQSCIRKINIVSALLTYHSKHSDCTSRNRTVVKYIRPQSCFDTWIL